MTDSSSDCVCASQYPARSLRYTDYPKLLAELLADTERFTRVDGPVDGFNEHYFRCTRCETEWAYLEPDGAYAGYWGPK